MRTFEIFMEVKKVKSIHTFTFWKLHFGTIWQDLKKRPSSSCQPKNLSSFVWRTINWKNLFLSKNLKKKITLTIHLLQKCRPLIFLLKSCICFMRFHSKTLDPKWHNIKRLWVVEIQIWCRFHDSRVDNFVLATRLPL